MVVDWDKDGHLDLLVGNQAGTVKFFKGAEDGSITPVSGDANPFKFIDVYSYASPTAADWDKDCHLDLLVGNSNGAEFVLVDEC